MAKLFGSSGVRGVEGESLDGANNITEKATAIIKKQVEAEIK